MVSAISSVTLTSAFRSTSNVTGSMRGCSIGVSVADVVPGMASGLRHFDDHAAAGVDREPRTGRHYRGGIHLLDDGRTRDPIAGVEPTALVNRAIDRLRENHGS